MKVIFLVDVPNVAQAGEIKEVANGYGRNFLIPKKLAVLANPSAASLVEAQRKIEAQHQADTEAEKIELAGQLEGKEVVLKAKVGAKDRLYGSITSADIAAELQNTAGLVIDKRDIELGEPIRQLGSHEVLIRLGKDITPKIKVIVAEEETAKKETAKKETAEKGTAEKGTAEKGTAEKGTAEKETAEKETVEKETD